MLTTEEMLNLDNINFHVSDANNIEGHEDFMQQLSAELDIPLLLDQHALSFDSNEDDLLSEVMTGNWPQCDDFDNLTNIDLTCIDCSPPINIKSEPLTPSSPESLYSDSFKSDSPTPSQSSDGSIKTEISTGFETPPISPQDIKKTTKTNKFTINSSKSNLKRVPIQPKPHYNVSPAKNKRKIVPENFVVNNEIDRVTNTPLANSKPSVVLKNPSKVVVLENVPVQSPQIGKISQVVNISPVQISSVPVIYNNDPNLITISNGFDTKALKRQQRMIKNRESACLSRKKKKDYLMSLEKEVADLKFENQKLKHENKLLKDRLFGKSKGIAITLPNKASKNTAFLLAVLFMVSINVGSIGGLFNFQKENSFSPEVLNTDTHHGRSLLWAAEIDTNNIPVAVPANVSTDLNVCSMTYVNQSESVRLARELHRWIAKPYNQSSAVKLKRKRRQFPPSEFRVPLRKNKRINNNNEIQVFEPRPEAMYSEFFEAINRRDDTFYVVSFNADNMLLPALHHNNTRRPKMSLLLPAMLTNETSSEHSNMISLMQIDCEVLDTRLLRVKSRSIPQHLRTSTNVTEDLKTNISNRSSTDNNSEKFYKPYFIKNGSIKSHIDRLYSEKTKKLFKYN